MTSLLFSIVSSFAPEDCSVDPEVLKFMTQVIAAKRGSGAKKKWVAVGDTWSCPYHQHVHGKVVPLDMHFDEPSTGRVRFPGDYPDGDPNDHTKECPCFLEFIVDDQI